MTRRNTAKPSKVAALEAEGVGYRAYIERLEADLAFARACFETCLEEWREDRHAAYPLSGPGSLQTLRDRIEDRARARQPQPEVPR